MCFRYSCNKVLNCGASIPVEWVGCIPTSWDSSGKPPPLVYKTDSFSSITVQSRKVVIVLHMPEASVHRKIIIRS